MGTAEVNGKTKNPYAVGAEVLRKLYPGSHTGRRATVKKIAYKDGVLGYYLDDFEGIWTSYKLVGKVDHENIHHVEILEQHDRLCAVLNSTNPCDLLELKKVHVGIIKFSYAVKHKGVEALDCMIAETVELITHGRKLVASMPNPEIGATAILVGIKIREYCEHWKEELLYKSSEDDKGRYVYEGSEVER